MNTDIEKEFEGCKLVAYPDPGTGGVPWTIGYGHTLNVQPGDTCSQDQADEWLVDDLHDALASVQNNVIVPLSNDELSALVDFVFNVGGKNFASSTLLRLLNAGDYEGAAGQFERWNQAGGHVLAGLTRRRAAEAAMFSQGIA
jgi:lysozyme